MKLDVDLSLLEQSFAQLSQTPYFKKKIDDFAGHILRAIRHVQSQGSLYDPALRRTFSRHLWRTHKYLAGSTVSDSPYEIEYCLTIALAEWVQRDCLITTTLSADLDFHFLPFDIWEFIKNSFGNFDSSGFDVLLAPMALPKLYKHSPLYCVPLYHELGHFIDKFYGVTDLSLIIEPAPAGYGQFVSNQRGEFFADLFAAQYVGEAAALSLQEIAPNTPVTFTHPSTMDRVSNINDFLGGGAGQMLALFQKCLTIQTAPLLKRRFSAVNVTANFDDVRPVDVISHEELHGLFPATWKYLDKVSTGTSGAWGGSSAVYTSVDRTINDLLEKSIRNSSIKEMWQ